MDANIIYDIRLSDITISELNVRQQDQFRNIEELKASILKHGLLQPVVLLGSYGTPPYNLIAGQRRFIAHDQLGLTTIRSIFVDALDENQIIIRSLVENMQRLDLDYVDTARSITKLYESYGKDDRRVSKETGLSLRKVRDYISIDALATEQMKLMLSTGKVTAPDVKRALRASSGDEKKAEELLNLMIQLNPTTNQKKRIVTYGQADPGATTEQIFEKALAPHIEETLVVALPEEIRVGLQKAAVAMNLDPEEFALRAIREWLYENSFLDATEN